MRVTVFAAVSAAMGLGLGLGVAPRTSLAAPAITSQYTQLGHCREVAAGHGEDWVANRCAGLGGVPVWQVFTDSTRMHLGFGARENVSGTYAPERDAGWPIEWRGTRRGGRFTPFAVIVRVRAPDAHDSSLMVYRLRPNGTSCLIGEGATRNEDAHAIADATAGGRYTCLAEPDVP